MAPNQRLYIEAKENGNNNIHFNHLQATKIMCSRLLPKMKRSARYVAGSVAIFISYSFVRIHSLSSPKSLTNQYPKVKLPEILGIWARKVEVMRLFTTPVWERSRGTPRQQFHSLLKGSCCALTWQQADATNGTETSRLMALKFGVKLINHEKSLPR